ncbi:MAG: hypothetical protein ACLVJK_12285, partial [Alistipes putredinis]
GETVCFSDLGEAYSGLSGKGGDDFGYGEPFITYMNVHQNTYISEKDYELGTNRSQRKAKQCAVQ